MASAGPNYAGTGADDASTGTVIWSNPGNITSSDNIYATATTGTSHYLKATNFSFSIPSNAIIKGIQVDYERKEALTGREIFVNDTIAKIVKNGTIQGTDLHDTTEWPLSDTFKTYGSSSQLWGLSWTAADINASDFGFALSEVAAGTGQIASVDSVRITVYYALPSVGRSFIINRRMSISRKLE